MNIRPAFTRLALAALISSSCACADWHSFWDRRDLKGDVAAMEDPIFADERRSGIAGVQRRDEGKEPQYLERFRQIARTDSSPLVRAQAVRALNSARDGQATPVYLSAVAETEPKVQLEAVKALRHAPDERAVPRLTELVNSDQTDRDVRIWAAKALGCYPRVDVARALASLVTGKDFAVAVECRDSLWFMTGKDFHYDAALWLGYLTSSQQPFKIDKPTPRLK